MSAYFVVELEITNPEAMEPYRAAVGATIEQYGGRFLARAGATELIGRIQKAQDHLRQLYDDVRSYAAPIVVIGPGSYVMASTILSDQALGTYGTVTVTR